MQVHGNAANAAAEREVLGLGRTGGQAAVDEIARCPSDRAAIISRVLFRFRDSGDTKEQ